MSVPSDIEIARAASMRPIGEIAAKLGLPEDSLEPYGRTKAKIALDRVPGLADKPDGKLILVTAMTPTPAGEGKTTTTVGLGDGLNRIGKKAVMCLREPSLGPCFGQKGGAAGGGYAQVVPMEDINLHFTGDFHAIASAHNLLAAVLDNHLHFGNALNLEPRTVIWRRVLDMNDRALRHVVLGLGGRTMGIPRESGFDITAASEVMAIVCLARDRDDLQRRLGSILIGQKRGSGDPVFARDLEVDGAMAVLLKDALLPNLVQTLEGTPALIHGGPFANIAHGANSIIATRAALGLADYVVTEAGFGFDLGAEKFLHIKCPIGGLKPSAVVLVATVRALKVHGGSDLGGPPDAEAVRAGLPNLERHLDSIKNFGLMPVVALNHFGGDTDEEVEVVAELCRQRGLRFAVCRGWAEGGAGAEDLARAVVEVADSTEPGFRKLYSPSDSVQEKIGAVCRGVYGTEHVVYAKAAKMDLRRIARLGLGELPVCIAKTQSSLSDDPRRLGRPRDFVVTVRQIQIAAGAGFLVPITGDILRMPGLPRRPAAAGMGFDADGQIEGLS